jgi:hypothetical protein
MTVCYEYVSWGKKFAGNPGRPKKDYAAGLSALILQGDKLFLPKSCNALAWPRT